jgi:hypothetical protein
VPENESVPDKGGGEAGWHHEKTLVPGGTGVFCLLEKGNKA